MTKTHTPLKGTFYASSIDHVVGGPVFKGTLTLPGDIHQHTFALWTQPLQPVGVPSFLAGLTSEANPSLHDVANVIRINRHGGEKLILTYPHAILLSPNPQVIGCPPPPQGGFPDTPPSYLGFYNPGRGQRLLNLDIWYRVDHNGKAELSGYVLEPRQDKLKDPHNSNKQTGPTLTKSIIAQRGKSPER